MLDKLAEVEKRYMELEGMMSDPQLLGQQREYSKLAKERAELEELVACYREWRKVEREIHDNRQLLEEPDEAIRELAKQELIELRERKEKGGSGFCRPCSKTSGYFGACDLSWIPTNSISKISVEFGPICRPAPRSP